MSAPTFADLASDITREIGISFPKVVRVLMVDDSETDVLLTKRALEASDRVEYCIESVGNVDPMATILTKSHDVYLMDVRVGRFDGLALIEAAVRAGHRGPFVVLTGSMVPDADELALRSGAMDYVDKSEVAAPRVLDRKIRAAIRNFRVQEALRRRLKRAEEAANCGKPIKEKE